MARPLRWLWRWRRCWQACADTLVDIVDLGNVKRGELLSISSALVRRIHVESTRRGIVHDASEVIAVEAFEKAVRRDSLGEVPWDIVVHLFSGGRYDGDYQMCVERLALAEGIPVVVLSAGLAFSAA